MSRVEETLRKRLRIRVRLQWLKVIDRNDLLNKSNFAAYRVCETHFNVEDIRQSPNRKLLKQNASPSLMLPSSARTVSGDTQKKDKQAQTVESIGEESYIQTENLVYESYTQTSPSLSSNNSRERNLEVELLQCKNKLKLYETENKTGKAVRASRYHGVKKEVPEYSELNAEEAIIEENLSESEDMIESRNDLVSSKRIKSEDCSQDIDYMDVSEHSVAEDAFACFGKYVAAMLRCMPEHKAYELQPMIVSLLVRGAVSHGEGQITQSDDRSSQ